MIQSINVTLEYNYSGVLSYFIYTGHETNITKIDLLWFFLAH